MNLKKVTLMMEAIKALGQFRNRDPEAKKKSRKKKLIRAKCKGPNMTVQKDASGNFKCKIKNRKDRVKRLVAWKKRKSGGKSGNFIREQI